MTGSSSTTTRAGVNLGSWSSSPSPSSSKAAAAAAGSSRSNTAKVRTALPWKSGKAAAELVSIDDNDHRTTRQNPLSIADKRQSTSNVQTPRPSTSTTPTQSNSTMTTPRSTGRSSPVTRRGEPIGGRGKDQWWESVLPPGQLAERLRRAQSGEGAAQDAKPPPPQQQQEPSRSPYRSSLRTSAELRPTPRTSSRRHHHSTASSSDHHAAAASAFLSPPSTIPSSRTRASTASSASSSSFLSSFPASSARSSVSIGESSSASSSNDEGSAPGQHSPVMAADDWQPFSGFSSERGSGATSPTASISRSQSNRRRRVLASEESGSVGLGVNIRGAKGHVIDLDERFRQWNDGMPFHHLPAGGGQQSTTTTAGNDLRPFPSSHTSRAAQLAYAHGNVFADTPDHSSEEDRSSTRTTRRPVRTSSTRTADTVRDGAEMRRGLSTRTSAPSSRRSSLITGTHPTYPGRRVSFNQDVEVVQGNETKSTQTIGRAHGRTISALGDAKSHLHRKSAGPTSMTNTWNVPTSSSSMQSLRDEEVRAHAHSHVRGKRMPCYSAPSSPKPMQTPFPLRQRTSSRLTTTAGSERGYGGAADKYDDSAADAAASAAELAVLSSLSAAQSQFRSAGSLALALTRQLSAPLRPFLHLTLFASISSMALMALAGFLVAGYLCTVWDDVNNRGKSLQRNVSTARSTIEKRVQWTRTVLGMVSDEAETAATAAASKSAATATSSADTATKASGTSSSAQSTSSSSASRQSRANGTSNGVSATRLITAPIRFALALPTAALAYLTPEGVRLAFSGDSSSTERVANVSSAGKRRPGAGSVRGGGGGGGHRHSASAPATSSSTATSTGGFSNLPPRPPLSSLLPSIAFTIVIACGAGLASFFANRAAADHVATPSSRGRATPNSSAPPSPSSMHHHHHHHHHVRSASALHHGTSGGASSSSSAGVSPAASPYHRRSTHSVSAMHPPAPALAHHVNHHFAASSESGRRSPFAAAR